VTGVPDGVRFDRDGLVPLVVQDVADGRVLMVGHADAEALAATLETGLVHFHSRSRGRLWQKGESSGNVLRLVDLALDCDGDAVLVRATPAGPTCHTGTRSCFDAGPHVEAADGAPLDGAPLEPQGFAWLERLWATIVDRLDADAERSYTARLVGGGVDAVGRKVVEEATEVLLAAKDLAAGETAAGAGTPGAADPAAELRRLLAGEAADLLYHVLVLLAERGVPPADVIAELRRRHRH
jgi:phosphoribosyl-ATP pyrophosphohydrolase/phosphoribosyl-AMP cyclohydrolase